MSTQRIMAMRNSAFIATEAAPFITGKVLDVGCGAKPFKPLFPECEWVGLDARPVGEIEADFDTVLPSTLFDTVLCTDALQFSRDPRTAVAGMCASLKDGGHLVITAPNCWHEDSISRYRFTLGGLGELVQECGLEVLYLDGLGGLWTALQEAYVNSFPYAAAGVSAEFDGWIGYLDKTYPMLTALIARKNPPNERTT